LRNNKNILAENQEDVAGCLGADPAHQADGAGLRDFKDGLDLAAAEQGPFDRIQHVPDVSEPTVPVGQMRHRQPSFSFRQ
jgi:hypothetical protein